MRPCRVADLRSDPGGGLELQVGDEDVRATPGQQPGAGRTDAGTAAGHDRDLAGEVLIRHARLHRYSWSVPSLTEGSLDDQGQKSFCRQFSRYCYRERAGA